MYKTFTASEHKSYFGFPEDYCVEGMLCYGTWAKEKQIKTFKEILEEFGKNVSYGILPGFLEKIVEVNLEGKRYWFDVSYGGAMLSEYLHLASIFGSKKNILLGSCGGLSLEINSLDFIVPVYSFGNESATRMYNPEAADNKHYANQELSQSLKSNLDQKHKVWEGGIVTCQAMMAETLEDVQAWSAEGFIGVEMETATVFAVSKHFNVPCAALLFVGDNLIKGETVASESYKNNKFLKEEMRKDQYRAALKELIFS